MSTRPTVVGRALAAVLAPALLGLLLLAGAPPAQAHDVLVEARPGDGAVLAESPEEVALTFSGEILELSPVIVVTGASSGTVGAGDPVVDGRSVRLAIPEALPADDYDVAWRVVSSDGHPIEGMLAFSVAAPDGGGEPAPAAPPATADAADPAAVDAGAGSTPADTGQPSSGLGALPMWLKIALMLAATGSVIGLAVLAARRDRGGR